MSNEVVDVDEDRCMAETTKGIESLGHDAESVKKEVEFADCDDNNKCDIGVLAMASRIDGVKSKCEFMTAKCADEKSVAIVGVRNVHGDLVVPAELGGFPVVGIRDSAFQGCTALKSVEIPDSVTSIGDRAFANCSGLASVMISASVRRIGYYAFENCSKLNSFFVAEDNPYYKSVSGLLLTKDGKTLVMGVNGDVTIPDGVTRIAGTAFEGCDGLTSISIPDSVTSIEYSAFSGCEGLKCVILPKRLTRIENYTFSECSSLESVTMPDGLASIEKGAFSGCWSLTDIIIPASVTCIEEGTFADCGNLNSFSVAENNQCYKVESGMLLTKDGKILIRGVSGNVTIPDGVAKIGEDAFSLLDITGITIPSSVTCIGSGAFFCCNKLKSLAIPDSVTSIGNGAFSRCRGLMGVAIPSGVESIGRFAFEECISLAGVTIPSSVKCIGDGAFNDTALKAICVSPGDSGRIKKLLEDSSHKIGGIKFVEREADVQ